VLALAEHRGASGRDVIDALVLGIDVACRIGNVMYPDHYDRGWHITGSTGMLGAAAGCARLLGLDEQQTMMALGIAASQPVGLREQFGTMTKPFHPGGAARAGLMSALMASQGFTASPRALEAPRGFIQVASDKRAWHEVTDELGQRFEISFNSYKPFACGIVIHPSIDACVQLRAQGITPEQVQSIELRVHSLVLELTGKKTPQDGLQGKFSVYHGCAAGLMFGRAGEEEFSDHVVTSAAVVALRDKVQATVDDSIDEAAADVTAVLTDGRRVHVRVDHAIGSLENPLSDAQLEAKFAALVVPVLGDARARDITAHWRTLAALPSMCAPSRPCAARLEGGAHHAGLVDADERCGRRAGIAQHTATRARPHAAAGACARCVAEPGGIFAQPRPGRCLEGHGWGMRGRGGVRWRAGHEVQPR
jgi:2-methylcitrate dehydratase PrpD